MFYNIASYKEPLDQSDCWKLFVQLKLVRNTELARAVDVMMAPTKRIYILMIEVNKLFFFFFAAVFSKRNRKLVLRVPIEL